MSDKTVFISLLTARPGGAPLHNVHVEECRRITGTCFTLTGYKPVADPGFLKGGFKFTKGGSFSNFYPYFLKFPHENEVIWFQSGVRVNPPNPL